MHTFYVGQTYFPNKPKRPAAVSTTGAEPAGKSFRHYLAESVDKAKGPKPLTFSQHALMRLRERGISLNEAELNRLQSAVQKAADKGAKESLILMDNVAYVVSIINRKVITAVDDVSMKENVFTNIDSAVFA
ncbi:MULTISPECIES: TIGR02530 family flagellar biosynthesis protein [Bacillales]|jgi:flagellar operon protein|uniref:Flagellar protein n=1 Tax=Brevibacillus aydinogluensis TaxID=927786 RepID=A0AA48M720_9BACL|nr:MULTISPECIES: TIGR02530 family flagellar biosynthesis protein [Bacillales]REK64208.1 MAG: flagellar protein [Brevibacillus sp.]MBR8659490.1 flagellar protein [Brevibacillus sp. NL20B1]MDT3415020.1 flagellar operon protein [Brevibacillus aydinogluensis]NNV01807.1 flagellar protein [Brevibacillus sp. MCWH]UFJ60829.1 flagellar protein [Anoxybacillus sediminis]